MPGGGRNKVDLAGSGGFKVDTLFAGVLRREGGGAFNYCVDLLSSE